MSESSRRAITAVRAPAADPEGEDRVAVALESLLAVLRSPRLDDRAARTLATDTAASALVSLRAAADGRRAELLEPVASAFERLRTELRWLERFGTVAVEFVEPPSTGRAVPGPIADDARAIVRSAVLVLVADEPPGRLRIQWDCDGTHLLIDIRDDGHGRLSRRDEGVRPIAERVAALEGRFGVTSVPRWGSQLHIALPLDPPHADSMFEAGMELTGRERDVLQLVATGARNGAIAAELGVSVNTVRYHVGNLLRKAGVASRAELAVLTRPHGPAGE